MKIQLEHWKAPPASSVTADQRHEPLAAEFRNKSSPVWDMSQERMFNENLLGQRLNFFLVFFGFMMAALVNAKSNSQLLLILPIGALVGTLLCMVLHRTQEKVDLIIEDLKTDPTHPLSIINNRASGKSRRKFVGYIVPSLCCTILWVLTIGAIFGVLPIGNNEKQDTPASKIHPK